MEALEYVDIGVIGEGEITSIELCRTLENGGDLSTVAGLIFKADNLPVDRYLKMGTIT